MARIRAIKPEITLDEDLAALGFAARYFFINLWCHVDREGRCEDRPRKLQALILPWDNGVDSDVLLSELAPKFIIRYESGGKRYIQVRKFSKHQRPHTTEAPSEIPAPTASDLSLENKDKSGKPVKNTAKHVKDTATNVNSMSKHAYKGNGKGKGEGNGVAVVPTATEKKLTPIQMVIRGFKEAKGVDSDDKEWDRRFYKRHIRAAQEVLTACGDNPMEAIAFILKKGEEWKHLSDWGLEAIVKARGREHIKIQEAKNGREYQPVGADRVLGPRRLGGVTSSGEIAGDALRSLAGPGFPDEGPRWVDGLGDNFSDGGPDVP